MGKEEAEEKEIRQNNEKKTGNTFCFPILSH
jgi:hypothetical protein